MRPNDFLNLSTNLQISAGVFLVVVFLGLIVYKLYSDSSKKSV